MRCWTAAAVLVVKDWRSAQWIKKRPTGRFFKVQSSKRKVQILCRYATSFIYWIATPSAMARNESEYVKTSASAVWTNTRIRTGRISARATQQQKRDCHVTLAMTKMWHCLGFSDHPAAARHPSNGGELGMVLYFLFSCFNMLSFPYFFFVIPWLDHGIQVMGAVAQRHISHSLDRHGRVAPSRWQGTNNDHTLLSLRA